MKRLDESSLAWSPHPQDLAAWLDAYLGRMYVTNDTAEHLRVVAIALRAVTVERDEAIRVLKGVLEGVDDYWAENAGTKAMREARALLAKYDEK